GFAKGGAKVQLKEDGPGTLLAYQVDAQVGGKLAQIGSRLIDGTARKLSEEFFSNFARIVGEPEAAPAAATEPAAATAAPSTAGTQAESERKGLTTWLWVGGLILIIIVLLAVFTR